MVRRKRHKKICSRRPGWLRRLRPHTCTDEHPQNNSEAHVSHSWSVRQCFYSVQTVAIMRLSLGNFLFVDISPNSGWRSNFGVRRVRGRIRATLTGVQPPLDGQRIDRETNPESPAKELSWFKVSQAAGGKEQPH